MAENHILEGVQATKDYQTMSPSKQSSKTEKSLEDPEIQKPKKVPRKVIHCSDGIYEEYSTDEEEIEAERSQKQIVDPKTLTWIPWALHYTWLGGSSFIRYCDHYGEKLAWFFGITSPKYYWELEEFKKMKEEEEARKKKRAENTAGWLGLSDQPTLRDQPKQLDVSALNQTELKYNVQENSCDMPTTELDAESPKLQK